MGVLCFPNMTPKNQSWVNISSAAKANGFFDSEKLSPSNIGDEYSTLTTSEMAEFFLADNRAEFCSKHQLPILDQVVQDCTDLGDFEVWSTESIPVPVKIQRKCRVALHEWYNYFSNFSGQLCNATEKDVRCRISAGVLKAYFRVWNRRRDRSRGSSCWGYMSLIQSYLTGI